MSEGSIDDVLAGRATWALVCADNADAFLFIPDGAVGCTITDPPYEAESHTKGRRIVNPRTGVLKTLPIHTFAQLDEETRIRCGGSIERVTARWALVFCQLEGAMLWRDTLCGETHRYMRTMVWVKPNGQPQLTGDRPGVGYECIVVSHPRGRSHWNGGGARGWLEFSVDANFSREPRHHETQKPIDLMDQLVAWFTDPGELVLDPFAGSGTTGVACLRLGRRFIGIEREPKYAEIARERLRAEERGLSLREARLGQSSIFDVLGGAE